MKLKIAMAALALVVAPGIAFAADGDAAKGEKVFRKCKACHDAEKKKNKVGPELTDVVGRKAGSVADYKYSDAMKAEGEKGVVWDEANLDKYLTNPREMVPGNKMSFAGLKKEQDRLDVIAYLKSVEAKNQ